MIPDVEQRGDVLWEIFDELIVKGHLQKAEKVATLIPDPEQRKEALEVISEERSNKEGPSRKRRRCSCNSSDAPSSEIVKK